jgi:hypothetical protein
MSLFRSTSVVPSQPVDRRKVWDDFRNDHQMLATLRVTPDEVSKLQTVFMLSRFTERQQLIEALNKIRCGWRP